MVADFRPYSFLDGSLNVLVADEDGGSASVIRDRLCTSRLFSTVVARTTNEAAGLLANGNRFHALVIDPGTTGFRGEKCALVRKHSARTLPIFYSGSMGPTDGAQAVQHGAKAVLRKGVDDESLLDSIFGACQGALIDPVRVQPHLCPALKHCIDVALTKKPGDITEWSTYSGVSDRYIRKLCKEVLKTQAKHVLFAFRVYEKAHNFFRKCAATGERLHAMNWPEYGRLRNGYSILKPVLTGLLK